MVKQILNKYPSKDQDENDIDESDLELEEEYEEDDEVQQLEYINDVEKLTEYTENLRQEFEKSFKAKGRNPTWIETMNITGTIDVPEDFDVDDDIKRELIFYNITHKNSVQGILKLKESQEKLNRPGDFFAEMIKSDYHMTNIRKKIVTEQQRIKKYEDKKQKLQNVKFAKAVNLLF